MIPGAATTAAATSGGGRRALLAIAIAEPRLRAWAMIAARRARLDYVAALDLAGLFDAIADGCTGVLIGACFDRLAAERAIAFVRAAGATAPVVVIATAPLATPTRRTAALAPFEVLLAPAPSTAAAAPRTEWLTRCVALAGDGTT